MPSRNIIRQDAPDMYYHVYARGSSKQNIFLDDSDYQFFMGLFARYVSKDQQTSRLSIYPHMRDKVEILAFCLMNNHFHLLLYQTERGAVTQLMRCIMTSYSRYFNTRYKRTGSLFESRFKSSRISTDAYLLHISRYIHLNPRYYKTYKYSSYQYFVGKAEIAEWCQPDRVTRLFDSTEDYKAFVADYESQKAILDDIKHSLADSQI